MAADLDVCNAALALVGQGAHTITAIGSPDTSFEAEKCEQFFAQSRDELLEEYPWTFSTRRVDLTLIDQSEVEDEDLVRPEWAYMYEVPADAMSVWAVLPPGAAEDAPTQKFLRELVSFPAKSFTSEADDNLFTSVGHALPLDAALTLDANGGGLSTGVSEDTTYYAIPVTADTFSVSATPGGSAINITTDSSGSPTFTRSDAEVILTNVEDAVARYSEAVTDSEKWPPLARRAHSERLASYLAPCFVSGEAGERRGLYWYARSERTAKKACAKNAQQGKTSPRNELPRWIKRGAWSPLHQPGRIIE